MKLDPSTRVNWRGVLNSGIAWPTAGGGATVMVDWELVEDRAQLALYLEYSGGRWVREWTYVVDRREVSHGADWPFDAVEQSLAGLGAEPLALVLRLDELRSVMDQDAGRLAAFAARMQAVRPVGDWALALNAEAKLLVNESLHRTAAQLQL